MKFAMFRRLSTELTVIYAGLFVAVMVMIGAAVFFAVAANSDRAVRAEMASSSAVFDQLWALREKQLSDTANVLARDFGFREAVATGDEETILSALDNIQARFDLDTAFIVSPDGRVVSLDAAADARAQEGLLAALNDENQSGGLLMLAGSAFQAVAAPINAPDLIGWVVFGQKVGGANLGELEKLSAIPLTAHLYVRADSGAWISLDTDPERALAIDSEELARRAFRDTERVFIKIPENDSIAGVKRLQPFGDDVTAVLLLEYSLKANQSHYRTLLLTFLAIAIVGLGALVSGTWFVSRRVTGPVSALHGAASRLAKGDLAEVQVDGRNEIAELASSFNVMSGEIAARERRIIHLAQHDNETGLPNLRALDQSLAALRASADADRIFGAAVGIDRFQHVRGAIGHALSARLVAEVAARISSRCPDAAVGRVATDIIGVLFTAESMEAARARAGEIVAAVTGPARLGADSIDVQVTVGLACDAFDADTPLSLVERAEVAVEQARAKRMQTAVFDRVAYGDPAAALTLMSSMISGLDRGELFLAHQPKFDIRTGRTPSAESLLRWKHPERGMIRPDSFIGMAEETGHIRPLTDWVLDRAIFDQRKLREAGHDVTLSINVSGRLIASEEFAERALRQVQRAKARMCFEITETAVIDNPEVALNVMRAFAEAGIGVSIDDYGSGLSSLSYLRIIPAQELKIDKAFIDGLAAGGSDSLLVKSTIDLAHSLGMTVTAEGVETAEQLAMLEAMGADVAQGYLIARPLAMADALAFWAKPPVSTRRAG